MPHAAASVTCKCAIAQFNPLRAAWRGRGGRLDDYPAELAAMLIYLNRTGYNGLFRLNASGEFNVPPGRYDSPKVIDRAAADPGVSGRCRRPTSGSSTPPFDRVLQDARAGDFVYFDPPYAPLSATANFRGYTGRGFSDADQQRLQEVADRPCRSRRAGAVEQFRRAVGDAVCTKAMPTAAAAGLEAWRFPARRAVNSRPDRRGVVEELVVSNIRPRPA